MQIATVVTIMMITMMMRVMMKVMITISGRDWNAVAEALICVRRTWPKLTPDQTMIKMRVMMARMIMVMVNMMMVMVNMIMMMINVLISMLALKPQESKPDFLQYISFISKRDCWRKSCHIWRMSHKRGFPVLLPDPVSALSSPPYGRLKRYFNFGGGRGTILGLACENK